MLISAPLLLMSVVQIYRTKSTLSLRYDVKGCAAIVLFKYHLYGKSYDTLDMGSHQLSPQKREKDS